jgi:hypothetical protein
VYTENLGLILGFHGCNKELADRIITGKDDILPSKNSYDWLGSGMYFWDRDPKRAYEFAVEKKHKEPSVVGAVIDPKRCLDLRCREGHEILREAYDNYCMEVGCPTQRNTSFKDDIPMKRDLDYIIIESACTLDSDTGEKIDTVIGTFFEGKEIYPGSGLRDKTHTQICVRNPECVLGYFLPRDGKEP